jgi:hypothetical protein
MHESRGVLNEQINISSHYVYLCETISNSICLLHRYTFDSAEKKIMHINHKGKGKDISVTGHGGP